MYIMKKLALSALLAAQLMSTAYAGMHEPEMQEAIEEMEEAEEMPYYVIIKGLYTLGDDVEENGAVLSGDNGKGFGIDFGYRIGEGFALEFDMSYERNTVTERRGEEAVQADVDFYTAAIDVIYTYEATEHLGIFAKVGFEYEWADSDEFGNENDSGMVVGGGVEYAIDDRYKFVLEYEHATIDSARGDGIFAGVMINFD
jgi:opacity protein-like surface antigen